LRRELLVPDLAIEIDVPEEVASRRLTTRGRADDAPEVLATRMLAYERETKPAIAVLERERILHRVDGDDDPQCVHRRVWNTVVRHVRTAPTSAVS
jgi:adenylate kinase family enzyme